MLDRREGLDPLRGLLHRWRLYALATRLWERSGQSAEPQPGERSAGELLGLDVNREFEGEVGPEETARVTTDFEENLRAILEMAAKAEVPVVLCTVPSNLRDWAPNQSFFAAGVPPDRQREVTDLVDRAKSSLESGDPPAAVELLERARAIAPAYAETQYRLGQAYAALGRTEDARRAWVAARDTDGQPSRAVSAINDTIRRLGAAADVVLVDVEADFDAASAPQAPGFDLFEDYVHPNPEAHRRIAFEVWRVILENGLAGTPTPADPEKFRAALSPVRPTGSDSMDLLFNLALVLENQGHDEQAMEKYRECIRTEPGHHAARMNLARLLHRTGSYAEALDQYRLALPEARKTVHHAAVLVGTGEALQAMGRTAEALDVLTRATRVDPGFAPAWESLGGALASENRHAESERAFRRATELDPDDVELLTNLGFSLLLQRRFDEAQEAFEQGLEHNPRHARARNGLAAVLTEKGDLDRAERIFRENLALDPHDELARGGLEIIRERRNR
jgi:tetratricopeptide (TPR) repeat protein